MTPTDEATDTPDALRVEILENKAGTLFVAVLMEGDWARTQTEAIGTEKGAIMRLFFLIPSTPESDAAIAEALRMEEERGNAATALHRPSPS